MRNQLKNIICFSKSSRRNLIIVIEIISSLLIISLFLLLFIKLGDGVLDQDTISFDNSLMSLIISTRTPLLTKIMTIITFFGSGQFYALVLAISILLFLRRNFRRFSVFSLTVFSGFSLNLFLKDTFQRPRPSLYPLINEASFSFPSGHAMGSLIFYSALAYLIHRSIGNKSLSLSLAIAFGILVLLIGISRIYLGVHYPSDILAGYSIGITWFVLIILFEKTHLFLKLFRSFGAKQI